MTTATDHLPRYTGPLPVRLANPIAMLMYLRRMPRGVARRIELITIRERLRREAALAARKGDA